MCICMYVCIYIRDSLACRLVGWLVKDMKPKESKTAKRKMQVSLEDDGLSVRRGE